MEVDKLHVTSKEHPRYLFKMAKHYKNLLNKNHKCVRLVFVYYWSSVRIDI